MKKFWQISLYVFLVASILWIYPYIWMVLASFKPANEIYGQFLPSRLTLEHYRFILQAADQMDRPFMLALGNSLLISVAVTLGVLVTSALVGFALSRLYFKGKEHDLQLHNLPDDLPRVHVHRAALRAHKEPGLDRHEDGCDPALARFGLGVFMFTQSFRAVPGEYLEAAKMDGANDLWIIARVLVPLTSSTASIVGLFTFIGIWDNFMWPLIIVSDYSKMPLSVLLASFNMQYGSYLGPVLAGSVLQTMPMVVIFLIFRKYFLQGISMSLK